jgi:hypothetical protein
LAPPVKLSRTISLERTKKKKKKKKMTRAYTVTSMEVLPQLNSYSDVVITIDFVYGDSQTSLNCSCCLPAPKDTFLPLESVTKEVALQWLLANCQNTTEELDSALDAKIFNVTNTPFVYDWADT